VVGTPPISAMVEYRITQMS